MKVRKTKIIGNKHVGKRKTLNTIVVNNPYDGPSHWIFRVLNNVFVSGLPGLVGQPVHPHWATVINVLFSKHAFRSVALVPLVGASCFPNLFSLVSSPSNAVYLLKLRQYRP